MIYDRIDTAIPCKEYELHLAASASSKRAHWAESMYLQSPQGHMEYTTLQWMWRRDLLKCFRHGIGSVCQEAQNPFDGITVY